MGKFAGQFWFMSAYFTILISVSSYGAGQEKAVGLMKSYLNANPNSLMWAASTSEASDVSAIEQNFVDEVDSRIRQLFPKLLRDIPKPYIAIEPGLPNAHVDSVAVCYHLPFPIIFGQNANNPESSAPLITPSAKGNFNSTSFSNCDHEENLNQKDLSDLLGYIRWSNGCELVVDEALRNIRFKSGCKIGGDLEYFKNTESNVVRIKKTSSIIWISDGLRAKFSNKKLLHAVLSHELGHYYMAHTAMSDLGFNKFFKFYSREPFGKPPRLTKREAVYFATNEPTLSVADLPFYSKALGRESNYNVSREKVLKYLIRAQKGGISKYTTETIADEFSLLVLKIMGIDPMESLEALIYLKLPEVTEDGRFEFNRSQCMEIYKNEWLLNKTVTYIPWGDYMEIHPSGCHRGFNAVRNILFLNSEK